jgi:hypothetical protein
MKTSIHCLLAAAVLAGAAVVSGQTNSINWYAIAGGGGTSTNGQYTVSGTIGQAAAGGPMTNGQYSLTGGFWAITAVQTVGAPLLTIRAAGNSVILSWAATPAGFVLQQTANVAAPSWVNYSGTTNVSNGTNSATITPAAGNLFFRLH